MASRVNVKFVIILGVTMVVLLGGVAAVWLLVVKKSGDDYMRLGDAALAAGEIKLAEEYYSKGVNHDNSRVDWLRKWHEALVQTTPPTRTAYSAEYTGTYLGLLNTIARQEPTVVANHATVLGEYLAMSPDDMPRGRAEQIAEATKDALSWFEDDPSADPAWPTLRRYRGLAFERLGTSGVELTPEEHARAIADLKAAAEANPIDGQAIIALSRRLTESGRLAREANDREASEAAYAEAVAVLDSYLEKKPNDPSALAHRLFAAYDGQVARDTWGLLVSERTDRARGILDNYREEASHVLDVAEEVDLTKIDAVLLARLRALEGSVIETPTLDRTLGIADRMLETRPNDARLGLVAANLFQGVGELDRTEEILTHVSELPDLPLSLDGLMLHSYRIEAQQRRAVLVLNTAIAGKDLSEAERAERIAQADEIRARLAEQLPEDAPTLQFIDGLKAEAAGDLGTAQRLYQSYNQQTNNADTRALWRQGQVALRRAETGTARDSFEALLVQQPTNIGAKEALAQIYLQLEDLPRALALYEDLKKYLPDNEKIDEVVERIRTAMNPDEGSDPITAVLTKGRNLRFGTSEAPADPAEAERVLEDGAKANDWDMQIATQLIDLRLVNGDFEGAREAFAAAAEANPDDSRLDRLRTLVESNDLTEAALRVIAEADVTEVQRELARIPVLTRAGRDAEAAEALARAAELEPDNPSVIERQFIAALNADDLAAAETLAGRAASLDVDRFGGASFAARLAAQRGDVATGIELLEGVVEQGVATPQIYRLLATMHRNSGDANAAAEALAQSLQIKPNDPLAVADYVSALVAAGRTEDALNEARRLQRFGRSVPQFVNTWLNLEAQLGGEPGRRLATERRERTAEINPDDRLNRAALAGLYIDDRRWDEARVIIDGLRSEEDSIGLALLDARWNSDQGQVIQEDGTAMNGLDMAQRVFADFILSIPEEEVTSGMYVALAQFMIERNRLDIAIQALEQARPLQDPETREADKLLANLLLDRRVYLQAAELYEGIVDGGADDPDQNYRMRWAEALLQIDKPQDTLRVLEGITEANAGSVTVLLQKSQAHMNMGDIATAREIIDEAIAKHPQNPIVWIRRATINMSDDGLVRDVEEDLNEALRLDPENWQALRARGVFYWTRGRVDEAIIDLTNAVRSNPNLDQVLVGLVRELIARDRDNEAIDLVNYVVEQRQYDVPLIVSMSDNFALLEQWARAANLLDKAWTRSKDPAVGLRYIEALVRQPTPRATVARGVYEEMTKLVPDAAANPQMISLDAMVLRAEGRPNSARRRMKESYTLVRESPPAILTWGGFSDRVHAAEGKPDEVVLIQELIDNEQPDAPQIRWLQVLLADRLFDLPGERERSLAMYKRLRETGDDEDLTVLLAYRVAGSKLYSIDRSEDALALWLAGLERFPEDWEIANNVAYLLVTEEDDAERALPYAEIAVSKRGNSSATQDTLANVYLKLGKLDEAQAAAKQADLLAANIGQRANALLTTSRIELARGGKSNVEASKETFIELRTLVLSTGFADEFEDELTELQAAITKAEQDG